MTLITGLNLPEDGQTASTTDYNAAITKIVDVINGKIDDSNISANSLTNNSLDASADPTNLINDVVEDMWVSGCVWTQDSGLNGTMTSGVVLINGSTYNVGAVGTKIFTANQDTYIDVGTDLTIDYTTVALDADEPALAADHVRLARVTTDGTNITEIAIVRRGGVVRDKTDITAKFPRTFETNSTSSITPNYDNYDHYAVTALTQTLTFNRPRGYFKNGATMVFRVEASGATRTLSYDSIYRAMGVTLPTSVPSGKTYYIGCMYNEFENKWDVISVARQA